VTVALIRDGPLLLGRLRKIMVKHTAPVATVRFSKDGKYLLSTSYDGSWYVANRALVRKQPRLTLPDDHSQVWNAVSGDLVKTISQSSVPMYTLSFLRPLLPMLDCTLMLIAYSTCGSWSGIGSKWALTNSLNSTIQLWALELEDDAKPARCVRYAS
jgi:WD40 repeat protein